MICSTTRTEKNTKTTEKKHLYYIPMNNDNAIVVKDLTVRFGSTTILDSVSFSVQKGEIFVVLGGSGCGKSTLLKHIIGLYTPLKGHIFIDGSEITGAEEEERKRILRKSGTLFQAGALFSSMTIAENVELPLEEYADLPRDIIHLIVRMKLALVGLSGFENYYPSEISGGMKKRAGLARAMALDPEILFFDEPSAGLDPVTSAGLDELILQLRESLGTTMVIVTHELPSIFAIADRVIMLDKQTKGIIAEGTPVDLRDHSDNQRVKDFFNRKPEIG